MSYRPRPACALNWRHHPEEDEEELSASSLVSNFEPEHPDEVAARTLKVVLCLKLPQMLEFGVFIDRSCSCRSLAGGSHPPPLPFPPYVRSAIVNSRMLLNLFQ